jgi:MerR family transcriptional regulator, redox-sensitive transcriptional activator SoxR
MTASDLTIGQVADRAGINASAIRFYEREGILPKPERSGGQRRYTDQAVRRLQVIDIAKRAGFTLDEIRLVLEMDNADEPAYVQLRGLVGRKVAEIDALIARAQAMRQWLLKAQDCRCSSLELCDLFADADRSLAGPRADC